MTTNRITFQYIGAEKECKSKHLSLVSLAQLIASEKYGKRVELLRRSIDHSTRSSMVMKTCSTLCSDQPRKMMAISLCFLPQVCSTS